MTNRSAPRAIVVPVLVYENVATALEWLRDAFGFEERGPRTPDRGPRIADPG